MAAMVIRNRGSSVKLRTNGQSLPECPSTCGLPGRSLGCNPPEESVVLVVVENSIAFAIVTAANGWAENHRPAESIGVPLRLRASEEEGTPRLVGVHLILAVSVNLLRTRAGGGQNYESKNSD